MKKLIGACFGLATMAMTMADTAQAALIVNAEQVGGDVVFSTEAGGSLDLSGLTFQGDFATASRVNPSNRDFLVGQPVGTSDLYSGIFSPPINFGSGGNSFADSSSGDHFGILDFLIVPHGYVSGQTLDGTATYFVHTLASLGLRPGTYNFTWLTDTGFDYISLNVKAVPVLPAFPLMGTSLAALGFIGWRRRAPHGVNTATAGAKL